MRYRLQATLFLLLGLATPVFAQITSTGTGGNWSATGSWVGGVVPGGGDNVVIVSGATISVDVNSASLALTMNGTAILDFPTNNRTLTVNGLMTMNGTSQVTGNNANRVLALQAGFVVPAANQGSIGGISVTQPTAQLFTVSGIFSPIAPNNGTKTLGTLIINQNGTWTASTNETYTFQGNGSFFDGCLLSGSSTATIVVNGNLTVFPAVVGQHTKVGQISITINGTTTVGGYLEYLISAAGTKTFNNTITVVAGGSWDNAIGEDPFINCSIVNNGSWPDPTGGN